MAQPRPALAARLGLFDATMLVMGGIVGSGIFINPYVVAGLVHTPALIRYGELIRYGNCRPASASRLRFSASKNRA